MKAASFMDAIEMLVNSEGLLLAIVDKSREHLILKKPLPPTVAEESTVPDEEEDKEVEEEELVKEEDDSDANFEAQVKEKPCCELDDSDFDVDPVIIPLDAIRQLHESRSQLQLWKGMAIGFAACFAGVIFHTC